MDICLGYVVFIAALALFINEIVQEIKVSKESKKKNK